MLRLPRALVLALVLAMPSAAPADSELPEASALLARVIGALPDIPLLIEGDLQARDRHGTADARLNVEMLLDWQDAPPTARYTLRDAFGGARSHLAITWPAGQAAEFRYFEGQPLQAAPLPDLVANIGGTDISWMDLSLSFLWWPGAVIRGEEDVRGRSCYVLDVPAPEGAFAGCSGVRLWIEPRIPIMLRAEAYDQQDAPIRRMEVKSFKKINDRWVIKDIELTSFPSRHKTFLRVRDVQDRTRKDFIAADEGGPEATPGPAPEDIDTVQPAPVE
jgi:hypothetical protein